MLRQTAAALDTFGHADTDSKSSIAALCASNCIYLNAGQRSGLSSATAALLQASAYLRNSEPLPLSRGPATAPARPSVTPWQKRPTCAKRRLQENLMLNENCNLHFKTGRYIESLSPPFLWRFVSDAAAQASGAARVPYAVY